MPVKEKEEGYKKYFVYQKKQQQINKNLDKMDIDILTLEKQSAIIDSILKKKK